ncbi:MAG: SMC-Scp complex subunit ScpB [Spongiibacteraceae bacterium]
MSVETVETQVVETQVVETQTVENQAVENDTAENSADEAISDESDSAPIPLPRVELTPEQLQRIVEGALLAAGKPLAIDDIAALFDDNDRPSNDAIRAALTAIAEQSVGRGFELREVASGFRFQVVQEVAPWIARLWEEKPQRYSRALLETLALIAYRQPITRGDIEDIRGVAVASNIIKTLLERDWVRVVGHKDVPGRPALYATTRRFLDYFNLKNLDDLPTLAEIRDLDSLNAELALEGADTVNIAEQSAGDSAASEDAVAAEIAAINELAGVADVDSEVDASMANDAGDDNDEDEAQNDAIVKADSDGLTDAVSGVIGDELSATDDVVAASTDVNASGEGGELS